MVCNKKPHYDKITHKIYDKITYEISHHTFQITNTKMNSMKINLIIKTNDGCNKNQHKCK